MGLIHEVINDSLRFNEVCSHQVISVNKYQVLDLDVV